MIPIGPILALTLAIAGAASAQPRVARSGFTSSVPGLRITPTNVLPRGPGRRLNDYCASHVIEARSTEARSIAARGWHVTAEAGLGRYRIVSFAGGFAPGLSGACFIEDGNIGLFEHGQLVTIVHGTGAAFEGTGTHTVMPATVTATGSQGRLRIWGEDYYPPLADLEERQAGAAVVPLAAADRWCGGAVAVPNIYDTRIEAARRRLSRNGWRPVPTPASEFADRSFGSDLRMRRAGILEVESCSGTGYGVCLFNYRHPTGPTLRVISAGNDDPHPGIVINYEIECQARR